MIMLCLVQVLDYEAQRRKNKNVLKCKECPLRNNCAKWVSENEVRNKKENK